ncbi:hypothetical protein SAMN05444411_1169 [Lutibacter oricola]|uniref:Uncharacterized protein n=1 Tax=Lutibacter oricola TaxID=762486 RepID=A0A1H3GT68_9FLAO|nr:hypothetical protein [Lutibacter oricola]SDY05674.1 hypothetical protein SAMN05444411_1169 [Lutibacter oricola]
MKEYLFDEQEKEFIQHLLNNKPKKIWYDYICYTFDYGDYYLTLSCIDKKANSQNDSDEALIAKLTRENIEFVPYENSKLVCKKKRIDRISIVRTFLYFSNFRVFSRTHRLINKLIFYLKTIIKRRKDPIDEIISDTIGVGTEYICNPNSDDVKLIDSNYCNLLDVGLLIEIDGKYLRAFLQDNGYGFHIFDDKFFYEKDDLVEDKKLYDFIKVDKNAS